MPDPDSFVREIGRCITALDQRKNELQKYLAAIHGLIIFLINFQKFIFKRLQKY